MENDTPEMCIRDRSDDELLDTEGGFTGWDDGTGAGAEETLEQALAEERLAELESELEQDEHPIDYEAELEDEEEEAASVSDKRLKREMRAEAIRRLEEAARTEKNFRAVVEEWNKLDRNCALPGFVDSKNEEKTERNAGYLVVSDVYKRQAPNSLIITGISLFHDFYE